MLVISNQHHASRSVDLKSQPRSQGLSSLPPLSLRTTMEAEKRDPGNEVVEITRPITPLIIYMQKFLHVDWLRACQLIPNSAKT